MSQTASLIERRQQAATLWSEVGVPTSKLEAWRHTHVKLPKSSQGPDSTQSPLPEPLEGTDGVIWMIDGRLDVSRSVVPAGVSISPIETSSHDLIGTVASHDRAEDGLSARNLAHFDRGIVIEVASNTAAGTVELLQVYTKPPAQQDARCLYVLDESAQLTLIERHIGQTRGAYFINQVTEVVLRNNACLEHCWIQKQGVEATHLTKVAVRAQRDGRYLSRAVQLGARLSRIDLEISLEGSGAHGQLDGLFHGTARQHHDNHMVVHHRAGHTTSGQHYRGVLDGRSTGIWRGNVLIHVGVRGCHTEQLNRNLLLSETATVHTKPQLEIDNDDVTASHGATIGQLDADALFYLRSRGIDPAAAERLLVFAFVAEVASEMPLQSLRELLYEELSARLEAAHKDTPGDGEVMA